MLVDSHCHLDFPEFEAELDAVVARAEARGVKTCVSIGTTLEKFPGVRAIADPAPLIEAAMHPKVVGIGETGLDYYYEHSPRSQQRQNFRAHIEAARVLGLPLIVHTRDAEDDTIAILREEMARGPFTGLIHCFTGTDTLAEAALTLGLSISVSGIATFKNSTALRDVLKKVPLDRLLVETDAPYLAPVPHRGRRNEPSFVADTASVLAALKNVDEDTLARATSDNFFRLFSKVSRPQ